MGCSGSKIDIDEQFQAASPRAKATIVAKSREDCLHNIQTLFNKDPGTNEVQGNPVAVQEWKLLLPLNLEKLEKDGLLKLEMFKDGRGYLRFKERIKTNDGKFDNLHSGQFNEQGIPHGIVRMVVANQKIYEGQMENGVITGWGRMITGDGEYYVGWWKKGKKCGYGKQSRMKEAEPYMRGLWDNDKLCMYYKGDTFCKDRDVSYDVTSKQAEPFSDTNYML